MSTAGLHYTPQKAMAEDDGLAEVLCVMMSLLFIHGVVCERWLREIDVMLKKKKGVQKIHTLG